MQLTMSEEEVGFWRPFNVQALSDGFGTWRDAAGGQRSSWKGNARLDLRAVRDSRGLLPYHEALNHNMRFISQLLILSYRLSEPSIMQALHLKARELCLPHLAQ